MHLDQWYTVAGVPRRYQDLYSLLLLTHLYHKGLQIMCGCQDYSADSTVFFQRCCQYIIVQLCLVSGCGARRCLRKAVLRMSNPLSAAWTGGELNHNMMVLRVLPRLRA